MTTQSSTVCVIGETVSIVHAKGTTLYLLTRPLVGRIPTIPFTDDGNRIEPPVSVPSAPRQVRAATAAPEPPLEPAGKRSRFQGLRQGAGGGVLGVPPPAEFCMFVFSVVMGPPRLRRA